MVRINNFDEEEKKKFIVPDITHERTLHFEALLKDLAKNKVKQPKEFYGREVLIGSEMKTNNPIMGAVPLQWVDFLLEKQVITREDIIKEKKVVDVVWRVGPYIVNFAYWNNAMQELNNLRSARDYAQTKEAIELDRQRDIEFVEN